MRVNKSIKKFISGSAIACAIALGSGTAVAATIYDPALSIPDIGTITVTPNNYVESLAQFKSDFGDLGDDEVKEAMESADWFGPQSISLLSSPSSGNCGTGVVTCGSSPKSGTYSGLLESIADDANLFVVHIGGPGGGTVLAFLYSTLINSFSVSGFAYDVSWIRAFKAPDSLDGPLETVPLPAGLVLLFSALGGLGFLTRFRKAGAKD